MHRNYLLIDSAVWTLAPVNLFFHITPTAHGVRETSDEKLGKDNRMSPVGVEELLSIVSLVALS